MINLKSFGAGFFSTLIFHQGLLALMHAMNLAPRLAYNMTATQPFGIPSVISSAFFGGLWGLLIWKLIAGNPRKSQIMRAIILGAVGPTLIAFLVVLPLKGVEFKIENVPFGLLVNGVWGLGLWVLMQIRLWI